jgi:hypothetical protein
MVLARYLILKSDRAALPASALVLAGMVKNSLVAIPPAIWRAALQDHHDSCGSGDGLLRQHRYVEGAAFGPMKAPQKKCGRVHGGHSGAAGHGWRRRLHLRQVKTLVYTTGQLASGIWACGSAVRQS